MLAVEKKNPYTVIKMFYILSDALIFSDRFPPLDGNSF